MIVWVGGKGEYMDIIYTYIIYIYKEIYIYIHICRGGCICMFLGRCICTG